MSRKSSSSPHSMRTPKIYAYTYGEYQNKPWEYRNGECGWIKVGYTTKEDVMDRIKEQTGASVPDDIILLLEKRAITDQGESFTDTKVHQKLMKNGAHRVHNEWFEATPDELKIAIAQIVQGRNVTAPESFEMRPEQQNAVTVTADYFRKQTDDKARHFLWNAKMRFGKTFTAYQLALEMGWTKLLILTYKPAVEDSWKSDLEDHQDFEGWQFLGKGQSFDQIDESSPYVWMVSFQDIMQRDDGKEIKDRLELVYVNEWDCIIIDEYHFGAWRTGAKELYDSDSSEDGDLVEDYDSSISPTSSTTSIEPLHGRHRLYLSGTPFRALAEGEFSEDQIFNWTYADEQSAKQEWTEEKNPYSSMPQLQLFTYKISDALRSLAESGFDDEFDLTTFFKAKIQDRIPCFCKQTDVQKWVDWLHKSVNPREPSRYPGPFANPELRGSLNHTVWHMPDVNSCRAMKKLLDSPQNPFFHDYKVICAAGARAGVGIKALGPVRDAIGDGSKTKTITLTCGKLLTGVTVPQWGAIFMLRETRSAETYFQAAFRVQSPWIRPVANDPHDKEIVKHQAYIFDFAQNRALEMIYGFCAKQVNAKESQDVKSEVRDFLNFLPILAYSDGKLVKLNETDLMDIASSGIGSAMLAKRWQSSQLINLDIATLQKILNNEELLRSLENMEAFRALRKFTSEIINAEESIKKAKRTGGSGSVISDEKRKMNKHRKEITEALLKFLTRVPVFMYLTDYREESLIDVIRNIESALFTKVTGLKISDFDALCKIGVFNTQALNQSIYMFKRQEAASFLNESFSSDDDMKNVMTV